jgi:hypothetical protein
MTIDEQSRQIGRNVARNIFAEREKNGLEGPAVFTETNIAAIVEVSFRTGYKAGVEDMDDVIKAALV